MRQRRIPVGGVGWIECRPPYVREDVPSNVRARLIERIDLTRILAKVKDGTTYKIYNWQLCDWEFEVEPGLFLPERHPRVLEKFAADLAKERGKEWPGSLERDLAEYIAQTEERLRRNGVAV